MEMNKAEVKKIAETVTQVESMGIAELGELQLALIGGGVGEIVLS